MYSSKPSLHNILSCLKSKVPWPWGLWSYAVAAKGHLT